MYSWFISRAGLFASKMTGGWVKGLLDIYILILWKFHFLYIMWSQGSSALNYYILLAWVWLFVEKSLDAERQIKLDFYG